MMRLAPVRAHDWSRSGRVGPGSKDEATTLGPWDTSMLSGCICEREGGFAAARRPVSPGCPNTFSPRRAAMSRPQRTTLPQGIAWP